MPAAYPMISVLAAEHIRDLNTEAAQGRRARQARRARRGRPAGPHARRRIRLAV
jgi:hypothetical protein